MSSPGEIISNMLRERSLSVSDLSMFTGLTPGYTNLLLQGKVAINNDVAVRLSRVLGGTADFWMCREQRYREQVNAISAAKLAEGT